VTDEAIDKIDAINRFLRQKTDEHSTLPKALEGMAAIVGGAA
jgi:type III secretion protein N (ATPase)